MTEFLNRFTVRRVKQKNKENGRQLRSKWRLEMLSWEAKPFIKHTHTHTQGTSKSISAFVPERKTHTDKLERIWQILRNVEGSEKCYAKNYIFIRDKEKAHTQTRALKILTASLKFR